MNYNTKLRILSKLGILLVFIGFFLPVSCNLNGFQLAKTFSSFGEANLISISLYLTFIFSCIGLFLLVLLLMKINYRKEFDWVVSLLITTAFVTFIIKYVNDNVNVVNEFNFIPFNLFQAGAYIIFSGIIISWIPFLLTPSTLKGTHWCWTNGEKRLLLEFVSDNIFQCRIFFRNYNFEISGGNSIRYPVYDSDNNITALQDYPDPSSNFEGNYLRDGNKLKLVFTKNIPSDLQHGTWEGVISSHIFNTSEDNINFLSNGLIFYSQWCYIPIIKSGQVPF